MLKLCTLLTMITMTTTIHPNVQALFSKAHDDFYWEAFVQAAKGNKETACHIVNALRNNLPLTIKPVWKEARPDNIESFFDKIFVQSMKRNPQGLSDLGLFESIEVRSHNAHLNTIAQTELAQTIQEAREHLHHLRHYKPDALSPAQQVSHKIATWMLEHTIAGEPFMLHHYTINQFFSPLQDLFALFTQFHKLELATDVEHYIARLVQIPTQLQEIITMLELQRSNGIMLPRFAIEKVIAMIERSLPAQAHEHLFYTHLAAQVATMDLPNTQDLLVQAKQVMESAVYPAYTQLKEYCTKLLTTATTNHGVWVLPNGEAYYAYMLQRHTTTNLSADEIHTIGLQEVAKIQAEMRAILASEHITSSDKSVGALVQELASNPELYYPNTDEGREQCLADYRGILERIRKELGHLFGRIPTTGVAVKRVPKHEEEGAAGAYYFPPSADGSRPGTFFANLRDMTEIPKYGMETLAIHEAEPGHHFQFALQYEMDMPMFRKFNYYNAYAEGWALYTEKLAYEHGFYSSSFSKLGHLQDELLRAVRLVVDTGIHHKRWTREQAIEYMQEATGYHYNSVVTEIERYFVWPGQACSYKIGQLKILELRKKAQDALGERFDIRAFHDEVLQVANVPLAVLEEVVEQHIARRTAS